MKTERDYQALAERILRDERPARLALALLRDAPDGITQLRKALGMKEIDPRRPPWPTD